MAISPQAYALSVAFSNLRGIQSACSFNTGTLGLDELTFARTKIAGTVLAPYQQQFLQAVVTNTGLHMSPQDLSSNSTFLDLLNQYRPLQFYFGNYLRSMAAPPGPTDTLQDFYAMSTAPAFPNGSGGARWQAAKTVLTDPKIVPPECYTPAFQGQVEAILDAAASTMNDVVTKIMGLG